jgi:hypothetical protein
VRMPANGDERVLITAQGYAQLSRDLDRLRNEERQRLTRLLHEARVDGDLDDNPALIDLLDEQAQLERRIATLEVQLAVAEVGPRPATGAPRSAAWCAFAISRAARSSTTSW